MEENVRIILKRIPVHDNPYLKETANSETKSERKKSTKKRKLNDMKK